MVLGGPSTTNYTLTGTPTDNTTLPKMNRQKSSNNIIIQAYDLTFLTSPTPSYSFHGSNSSHSKDSGKGGRTYHVPNYATRLDLNSYANEKTHLISVAFDEHKGANRLIVSIVFMFLLLLGSSAYFIANKPEKNFLALQTVGSTERIEAAEPLVQHKNAMSPPTVVQTVNPTFEQRENGNRDESITGEESNTALNSGLYWDELQGNPHCTAYGTRRYSARLRNVPFWANRTRACLETPVQINGVILLSPDECEVDGFLGQVNGFWNVNFGENDCTPVWDDFVDGGCVNRGSHQRLFRARLKNIKSGEDPSILCSTTPAQITGVSRAGPDSCKYDKAARETYGRWVIDDPKC